MPRLLALFFVAVLASPAVALASKPCPRPSPEMLQGTWIGQGNMGGFAQLKLDKGGSGVLAIEESLGERPVSVYRLSALQISGYTFSLAAKPSGKSPPTKTTGEFVCAFKLFRQVTNRAQSLETYELEREDWVLPRIRAVQQALGLRTPKPVR